MEDRSVEIGVVNKTREEKINNLLHQGLQERQFDALEMRDKGATKTQIAKHFNVSVTTIGNWLGKAGRIITRAQREE